MFNLIPAITASGHLGLFAVIFAESGLLIGFFFPGDSLLFTTGFLASQGYFNIWVLLVLFFVAAFTGDSVGYLIGKKIGPKIFKREKSFWFNPGNIEKTKNFFERHGNKTIILARFVPIVRTFAPVMAGVGSMKYRTFLVYNIIGAFIWAVGVTAAGYLFGNVVPNADKYVLPIVLLIVGVSLIPPALEFWREWRKGKGV